MSAAATQVMSAARTQPDPIRPRLAALVERDGEDMAGLSRMIGRAPGYVAAYLRRGTPRVLPERERALLVKYFGRHEADMLPLTLRDARREQMRRYAPPHTGRPM